MSGEGFKSEMTRLINYFGKDLKQDQKTEYEKKLGHIPQIALPAIVDELIENRRPTPGAFPTINRIKNLWYEWQRQNPRKIERRHDYQDCNQCLDNGVLWFMALDKALGCWAEYFYLGSECDNWKRHFVDTDDLFFSTRALMESQGLAVWPYES